MRRGPFCAQITMVVRSPDPHPLPWRPPQVAACSGMSFIRAYGVVDLRSRRNRRGPDEKKTCSTWIGS